MSAHGAGLYPVMGEQDATSGDLIGSLRTHFPMLPDEEIRETLARLRGLNDLYGDLACSDTEEGQ